MLQRVAIVATVDSEREAKLSWTVREIDVASCVWPRRPLPLDSRHRFDRANEDRTRLILGACDRVHTPVHAVDEIHIRNSWRTVERLRACSASDGRVTGEIVLTD